MPLNRIAPTARPEGKNDGTQSWQSLLFAHWQISADALRPHVPAELEIDTFDGQAFIGIVPFKMRNIRPRWLPRFAAFNFLETNLRTYVVHRGRPGVFFFSLDASSRLAVWAARLGWSLPYYYARMAASQSGGVHRYSSERSGSGASHDVAFRVDQFLGPSQPGSLEHFLLERYLLFVNHREQIYVGTVHHSPYQAHTAIIEEITDNLILAAGLPRMDTFPQLAHYCEGVDVEVFAIQQHTLQGSA
jgi:uncharacterized protein YqjF (DUF2071 family)